MAPMIIRQGLWICGILPVPGCAILWNTTRILILLGQDPGIAQMAGQYMDYYLWSTFPIFSTSMFSLAFTTIDRTKTIVLIVWLEVALNVILNYGLVFGNLGFPAMGIAGSGLASIIVYITGHMAFFIILAFYRFYRSPRIFLRAWRPKWTILRRLFRLGLPVTLQALIQNSLFSIFSLLAGWISIQAVAAYTIALQTALMVSYTLTAAVTATATVRMSIAHVRKDHVGMWHALNGAVLVLLIKLLPLVVIFWMFPEWIVTLFVGSGAPEIKDLVSLTSPLIVLVAVFVIADGLRMIMIYALNGLSDITIPTLIAVLAYWGIALPFGAWLGFVLGFGVGGFWIGLTLGMGVAAGCFLARFLWLVRGL